MNAYELAELRKELADTSVAVELIPWPWTTFPASNARVCRLHGSRGVAIMGHAQYSGHYWSSWFIYNRQGREFVRSMTREQCLETVLRNIA